VNSINESDLAAEQSVLGAIFIDSNILDDITFLEIRDFSVVRHQSIYKVMRYLDEKGEPVDIVTVMDAINKFGEIGSIGGVSYLSQLAASCPTTANVEYYARIVRSKAIGRRAQNMGTIISGMSRDDYESDEELFSQIENLVSEMRPKETGKMKSFSESREEYFRHLSTKPEFIRTRFPQFDIWAQGLWRQDLFVSAGRPSVGKTALLLQRLHGVAQSDEGVVLLWSQEMDENQVKDRMISRITGIPYAKIRNKKLNDSEKTQVKNVYDTFDYLPIFIDDSAGVSIDEIKATARQFKRKYGKIAVIAVDYLQIMNIPQKKGETRAQAIGKVTGAAKQIAREMNCCFMMLSQMSREFEKGALKPQLSHLKESGSIEQDADVVEFLWYNPNDDDATEFGSKVVQQTIAKGRNTGLNEFRLLFRGWKQHFEELPRK
jgi:replicative DNA helicase